MKQAVQFVFVTSQLDISMRFDELCSDSRVIYKYGSGRVVTNPIIKKIRALHLSTRINRILPLPFKGIWGNSLKEVNWEKGITYYVIFTQGAAWPIPPDFLKELCNEFDIHYIMLLYDFWDSKYARTARYYVDKIHFDYLFSFDPDDCQKYGFLYMHQFYTVHPMPDSCTKYDLYYAGVSKGRLETLHNIYNLMVQNEITTIYRITEVKAKEELYDGILYNERIKYNKLVEEDQFCNCILEVMADGQSGATLRYYEAVCYNKKLLTNNKNVVNLPFYDPAYIRVFEKPEDIDWNWVKERIPVDYHYDGRFSPTHLIDKIIQLEEGKEAPNGG